MPPGRRTAWKTSSQRRRPGGATNNNSSSNNNSNNNAGIGGNARNAAVSQYTKQLNPYKSSTKPSTSLRGSRHSHNGSDGGIARRPSEDVDIDNLLGGNDDDDDDDDLFADLGLGGGGGGNGNGDGDDDSDDDLGLDDILSGIAGDSGIGNIKKHSKAPSSGGGGKSKTSDLGLGGRSRSSHERESAMSMPNHHDDNGEKIMIAAPRSASSAVDDAILDDALFDDDDDDDDDDDNFLDILDEKKEAFDNVQTTRILQTTTIPKMRPQQQISSVNFDYDSGAPPPIHHHNHPIRNNPVHVHSNRNNNNFIEHHQHQHHHELESVTENDFRLSTVSSHGALEDMDHEDDISDNDNDNDIMMNDDDDIDNDTMNDNDTLWSDGDATRQHKEMMARGSMQGPAFASGFEDTTGRFDLAMSGHSFQTGAMSGSSLVDSIIDDISMPGNISMPGDGNDNGVGGAENDLSGRDEPNLDNDIIGIGHGHLMPPQNNSNMMKINSGVSALTPQRGGRYMSNNSTNRLTNDNHNHIPQSQAPEEHLLAEASVDKSGQPSVVKFSEHDYNNINNKSSSINDNSNAAQKGEVLGAMIQNNKEDETLSTVTDPTESPYIYTYKKERDDDSVSQITSSLAGNSSSMSSSYLQNVPATTLSSRSSASNRSNGVSWMNNGNSNNNNGGVGGGVGGGRGMIHRKGGLAMTGPYGRDRGSRKVTAKPAQSTGGRGSNSGSGSVGSSGSASYDGGKSALDEIAYSLNADTKRPGAQHRRPPQTRVPSHYAETDVGAVGNINSDDLSTVESSTYADGEFPHVDTNIKSNVSRLGMGGVSCAPAHSISDNASVISESSTSTMGFFQSLSLMAWMGRHHAERFFFPTSPAVTRRKKFDESDSMEELEDMLLEEGANSLPRRKNQNRSGNRSVGSGHGDEEEEEEIDYFSRAMSVSNGNLHNTTKSAYKPRKKYCWESSTVRLCMLSLLLTVVFTYHRMPAEKKDSYAKAMRADRGRGEFRSYASANLRVDKNAQIWDPATDAMVDASQAGGRGRVAMLPHMEEPMEDADPFASDEEKEELDGLPQQPQDQNEFLVNGVIELPSKFEVLANVDDLLFQRGIDVPFYWHVPRSGGGTMNDVLGSCLHLTLAADAGAGGGHGQDETLKVIHFSKQVSYVNVDTSTHQGVVRAKDLNLVSSGLADVVISPLLHEASTLFTPTRRGRMFTVFRHPVERAASLFYFIQETQWKQPATRNDQFADITIEKFYRNGFAENNWMTRFLTNELTKGELTENDLTLAKEVLRQKCVMGLLEEKGETFQRIQNYFGWRPKNDEERECLEKKLEWDWPMKHKHPEIEEGSRAWRFIVQANTMDMRLYEYAKELFVRQGKELFPR